MPRAVDTEAAFLTCYAGRDYAFWLDSSLTGGTARFSFLGGLDSPQSEVLTYRVGDGTVAVRSADGTTHTEPGTIFDALATRTASAPYGHPDLPFDFLGGYVGYFGYELKADCGGTAVHRAATPDAVWLRCDRFIAVDHAADRTYLVAVDGDEAWLDAMARSLSGLRSPSALQQTGRGVDPTPFLERSPDDYVADVKRCLEELAAGRATKSA